MTVDRWIDTLPLAYSVGNERQIAEIEYGGIIAFYSEFVYFLLIFEFVFTSVEIIQMI